MPVCFPLGELGLITNLSGGVLHKFADVATFLKAFPGPRGPPDPLHETQKIRPDLKIRSGGPLGGGGPIYNSFSRTGSSSRSVAPGVALGEQPRCNRVIRGS